MQLVSGNVSMPTGRHTAGTDTPVSRSDYYSRQCGLRVAVRPGGHIVATATIGQFGGFTMPVGLGTLVKAQMKARNIGWGPIVAHPRARRWTFLVDWDATLDAGPSLDAELMRANVTAVHAGGEIALPSPTPGSIQREWVINPNNAYRPTASAVLNVIRYCVSDLDRRSR
ncbi:DNA-directed RNA polymerase subunit beta [Nocardia terpenica]|uniref:DNA-directed RNA polymerase subunit beta n=1 Tax=Nocardia terpenica TaxID=455432 RepID=UPI0018937940|nr:DNA-directed RNA polymerase subunit beta [Nocardia terpenica]MBF6062022.1 DNA-directed RNA polymerase subunit beta [Nocardia terpenica]MBF6106178.1 DNA-directed RNA polymerase subunit beta [Nocardia terpenica]MBF6110442.1 DNA-directed RNA polymerase subunit beta [Nocardia terpenica]MBF6120721.1 DNA-directed RNA polymerase subunit beta [Nocardia terpenica]MBF6151778.1 DNA-directed RNA polymerase subunit beta [Nocardia terpenica]